VLGKRGASDGGKDIIVVGREMTSVKEAGSGV